jgi:hypothetical protein
MEPSDEAADTVDDDSTIILHAAFHWSTDKARTIFSFDGKIELAHSYPLSKVGSLVNARSHTSMNRAEGSGRCMICDDVMQLGKGDWEVQSHFLN